MLFALAAIGCSVLTGLGAPNIILIASVSGFSLLVWLSIVAPDRMFLFAFGLSILIPLEIAIKWPPFPGVGPSIIVLVALLLGASVHFTWQGKKARVCNPAARLPMAFIWTMLITASLVSTAFSVDKLASFYAVGKQVALLLGLVALLDHFLREPGFWPRIRAVLYLATAAVCIYAFAEEVTHWNIFLQWYPAEVPIWRGGLLRVRSSFFHPIAFGTYLAMVYPFAVVDAVQRRRLEIGGLVLLIVGASILTASRGPWLAMTLETLILVPVIIKMDYRVIAACALGFFSLACMARFCSTPSTVKEVQSVVNPNDIGSGHIDERSSEYYRFAVASAAIDSLHGARWIYGFGPGTFYLADIQSDYAGQDHVLTAGDSQYALTLVELGLVGLLLLVAMLVAGALKCLKAIRESRGEQKSLAIACFAAVIGLAVNSVTASMLILYPLNLMFWMAIIVASRIKMLDLNGAGS